ncbi:MAG: recombinase family protein [Solirubrobacterales bacterium]
MNPIPVRRVLGYARVSTADQAEGTSLGSQRERIEAECERRGWELAEVIEDPGASGKSLRRPGMQRALAALEAREADGLMVAKQDRLTRSNADFAALIERSRKQGWALTALDMDVDTSTAAGEVAATVIAAFAHFERRRNGERVRESIKRWKQEHPGRTWGEPPRVPAKIVTRIKRRRSAGWSLRKIADALNREDVATAHGGERWHASTVRAVLQR